MSDQLQILSDIERAALDRLKNKGLKVNVFEVKKDTDIVRMTPAVRAVIADGKFSEVTQKTYRIDASLYVIIIFRHVSDEESRRKGIYPILLGVVNYLGGQKLGLDISRLMPGPFREITNAEDTEKGLIVFQLQFRTWFHIDKLTDEQAGDLLKIGVSYYLKPGDDVADAQDEIDLTS